MAGIDAVAVQGLDSFVPETIPRYQYFLQEINTPGWQWLIRGAILVSFLVVVLAYRHYRRKAVGAKSTQ